MNICMLFSRICVEHISSLPSLPNEDTVVCPAHLDSWLWKITNILANKQTNMLCSTILLAYKIWVSICNILVLV